MSDVKGRALETHNDFADVMGRLKTDDPDFWKGLAYAVSMQASKLAVLAIVGSGTE